ncbi:PAS domain S-box protein [Microvirga arsenatis]|uniref:histidine kinase n=1 Tax=Microvirga arsenatis TaxID=2692265 RepID=A0ABW9Z8P1_9HYPH|nr:PAS domain S-box protein [Microvirga arsenatis]NBJ13832.1 PAS domain S-box protein [Microvirga arsenatis]NBJ27276.1 PAS domain S-box protein [Microvirga arsenatis]
MHGRPQPNTLAFLEGGGEMGARMRVHDWSTSPLGLPDLWPQSLRSVVGLVLNAKQPMFVAWGPDLAFFYNDEYIPIFGAKHPHALGRPFAEVWSDIWEQISPIVEQTLGGQASWHEDLRIPMERHGYPEETWFSFSYNPVRDESGAIAGMFCVCMETTDKVLSQRALRQSEERATGVLNGMDEAFVLLDREFRVIRINPAGLRMDARPETEIIGRTHWEVWPGTEDTPLGRFYKQAMAERVPIMFENRYTFPDGREAWTEIRAYPAPDGLAVFYRDISERKRAEDWLLEAEDHYRHTVELNPQVTWTARPDGQLDRVAQRWQDWTGTTGLGETWAQAMHPDDLEPSLKVWAHSVATGEPYDIEHRARMRSGEYRWMHSRASPRRGPDGQIIKWYGTTEDIHERRVSQDALQEETQALEVLNTALAAVASELDLDRLVQRVTDAGVELTGAQFGAFFYNVENEAGESYMLYTISGVPREAFSKFPMPRNTKVFAPTFAGEGIVRSDDITQDPAYGHSEPHRGMPVGHLPVRSYLAVPVTSRSGEVIGGLFFGHAQSGMFHERSERLMAALAAGAAVSIDNARLFQKAQREIEERRRAEEALRRLNETLEVQVEERTRERDQIWQLSTDLMDVCRSDGTLVAVNPAWTSMLGWSEKELLASNFLGLIHPDDVESTLAELGRLDQGVRTFRFENRFRTKDGSYRLISWTAVPKEGLFYAIGRDITAEREAAEALRQTEEALRQAQKMEAVGQLTGGIAHDFNNLLTGIIGSLDMLRTRISQGRLDTVNRYMTAATTSANRAAALTHRLLAFARRQPLDPKPVQANGLVASLEDLFRRTVGETVILEVVLAGGLWPTLCDPNQLESALLNLVINARDAMPDGGKLTIETCNAHLDDAYVAAQRDVNPGQYVCICVTDTGTGMSQDVIERAFDPFFTTKPIGQGTGLGLSMVYGFARQSEGHARIYSEIGQGTTIKIYLPRYRGETEAEIEAATLAEAPLAQSGETVLVVEDEPVVRGLILEVLEDLGYRTLEAADGPEGLKVLQSKAHIDLLITDVGLPGLNGRQLADAARERRPDLKVLFITGYAENATLAAGFLEPGMQMITKPFAVDALAQKIRSILTGADFSDGSTSSTSITRQS